MIDKENAIKALEKAWNYLDVQKRTFKSVVMRNNGALDGVHAFDDTLDGIKNAITLLKAQEPRVVKISELTSGEPMLVWLEDIDKEETVAGMIFDYVPGRLGFKLTDIASMDRIYPLIDEYLTRWRCWTSRPDNATREETPWD